MPPTFEYVTLGNEPVWKDTDARYAKLDRDLGNTVVEEVISIQFLEVDTSGTLLVINQDDTYEDVAPFPQLPTAAPHLFCVRRTNQQNRNREAVSTGEK